MIKRFLWAGDAVCTAIQDKVKQFNDQSKMVVIHTVYCNNLMVSTTKNSNLIDGQ